MNRRDVIIPALVGGSILLAGRGAASLPLSDSDPRAWPLTFEMCVRIPAGRLDDWNRFWGGENVALLEERGQYLRAAYRGLTGQQNSITHLWGYRDLTHYQAMAAMRGTDSRLHEAAARSAVPIEEILFSSVMTPTAYHPKGMPGASVGDSSVLVVQRILRGNTADGASHARLMGEFVDLAVGTGAELYGAWGTFFGWAPSYLLHVWRYDSIGRYWASRDALARNADARRLTTAMQKIYPTEQIELQQPLPYSRLT